MNKGKKKKTRKKKCENLSCDVIASLVRFHEIRSGTNMRAQVA